MENLYKTLGFTKATTSRKANGNLSLEGQIKRDIRETIHSMLLENTLTYTLILIPPPL